MAAIDEEIVREYFEQNGFFVRQGRKYQVQARRKTGGEEIDLLVFNPAWRRGLRLPDRRDLPVVASMGLGMMAAGFVIMNLALQVVQAGRSLTMSRKVAMT